MITLGLEENLMVMKPLGNVNKLVQTRAIPEKSQLQVCSSPELVAVHHCTCPIASVLDDLSGQTS